MCKALLELAEGWGGGVLEKNPFCGEVWIFSGITQFVYKYVVGQNDSQVKTRFLCLLTLTIPILIPRAHDPSGLWQGSRALPGPDFLSMRRVFVSKFSTNQIC